MALNTAAPVSSEELVKTTEHEDLLKMVQRLWSIGKRHRDKWGEGWRRYWKMYMGSQYNVPSIGHEVKPVVNVIFQHIESLVALVTANQLRQILSSREPNSTLPVSKFQKFLDYYWDSSDMNVKLPVIAREWLITGNSFIKVFFNPLRDELDMEFIPPMLVVVEPSALTLEDAMWVMISRPYSFDKIKMLYPDETEDLKPGIDKRAQELIPHPETSRYSGMKVVTPVLDERGQALGVYPVGTDYKDVIEENGLLVRLTEVWIRKSLTSYRYILVANNCILRDEELNISRPPLVHVGLYHTTFSFWSMGEVQFIETLQHIINRQEKHIDNWLNRLANPAVIVGAGAGLNSDTKIEAGSIIDIDGDVNQVKWFQMPSIPAEIVTNVERHKRSVEQILGNLEILQGIRPTGVESGKALQSLYEFANVRIQSRINNLEHALKELAEITLEMLGKFYPRNIPLSFVTMQGNKPEYTQLTEAELAMLQNAQLHVEIVGGSLLPNRQNQELQLAMALMELGIIDGVEVLKRSGFDNWVELAQKLEQRQAQAQQQAASQNLTTERR